MRPLQLTKPATALLLAALTLTVWTHPASAQQPPPKAVQPGGISLGNETVAPPDPSLVEKETRLRASLLQNPQSANALYELALVLRQQRKPRESLETYTRAAQLQKPNTEQLRSVALNYVMLDDYDDAERWLRVALAMEPNNTDILYSLGRCLYTKNLFPEAEKIYLRLLALDPTNLKAEENLGLTYDAQNDPQKAEKVLRTAAQWAKERDLKDPWPYLDLGIELLDEARPADAQPFLERAVELDPKSAWAHEKLGMAMVANGDSAHGIRELQLAAGLAPNDPKVHFELGHAYRVAGQQDKARAEFDLSKSLYGQHSQN
ncbi:tetratricopeptide repeat protein [Terracidiphilus gabretensis]|uniref:tetratricopeptide repeat protein n=1 Tax=Terracidiphilus gabretensis TaxID=1577687 RepID=UPI00071B2B5C|nr:tetratricopeptide repeat protein [Terracidiphilus gabretensis]